MTWYPDLSEYAYLPESAPASLAVLTVGWLDGQHEFPTGDVPQEFINELAQICATSNYARTRGWQGCELSHPDREADYPVTIDIDGNKVPLGSAEVRVATRDGTVLAAPNLVWHYVTAHHYRPPESFIEAVQARRLAPSA
jgi:hypothetical protein